MTAHGHYRLPSAQWITIADYARTYGITRRTIYRWLKRGQLEWYRFGQVTRIRNLPASQHRPDPPPVIPLPEPAE